MNSELKMAVKADATKLMIEMVGRDYAFDILNHEMSNRTTIMDAVLEDVRAASGIEANGGYNIDDVRLALGRVITKKLEESESINLIVNQIGDDEPEINWHWEENQSKDIENWIRTIGTDDEEEGFICNVRAGELCFDLLVRPGDNDNMYLWADLYVSGVDTGYGVSDTGKPYTYFSECGFTWLSMLFAGMPVDEFKQTIETRLTRCVLDSEINESNILPSGQETDLVKKALKPLIEW